MLRSNVAIQSKTESNQKKNQPNTPNWTKLKYNNAINQIEPESDDKFSTL